MKRLFRFRYTKLSLLAILSVWSYFIFSNEFVREYVSSLGVLGYLGIFIAGMCFAFGFSAPFAVGFFLTASIDNIFFAACIAGVGALVSDLLIFKMIRFSFMDEFERLRKSRAIVEVNRTLSSRFLYRIRNYLLFVFAGIVIASPLPDELGVSMLAGLTKIKVRILAVISFLMNSFGIFIILFIGK